MSAVAPLENTQPIQRVPLQTAPSRRGPQRREMVKSTDGVAAAKVTRPQLHVVPRRRRAVGVVVVLTVFLFALLLGAVAFQTQIARNQLEIDRTEKAVQQAREQYDNLRRMRAELRSPNRLAAEASALGMVPASNGDFISIDGAVAARVTATAGGLSNQVGKSASDPFDQFSEVKSVAGDAP